MSNITLSIIMKDLSSCRSWAHFQDTDCEILHTCEFIRSIEPVEIAVPGVVRQTIS
jgi:hypothetical protein